MMTSKRTRQLKRVPACRFLLLMAVLAAGPSLAVGQDAQALYRRYTRSADRVRAAERSGRDVDAVAEQLMDILYKYFRTKDLPAANAAMDKAVAALGGIFSDKEFTEYKNRLRKKMPQVKTHLLGQCHIDLAWRWPWTETVQITQSTFWNQIAAIEAKSDYRYHQDQAVLYEAMEQHDPSLFRKIQEKVKAGAWRIVGGQWSENSQEQCLGESLVRNFLYGQRYFKAKFGRQARIGWQMEGSGYLATFPQVMRSCGLAATVFGRQKNWDESWLPLVRWKGLDGAEIPTATIYHYFVFRENRTVPNVLTDLLEAAPAVEPAGYLFPFGGGDHGGGASLHLARKIARQFRAARLPKPTLDTDPRAYFDEIGKDKSALPTVTGHLHLAPYGQSDCGLITQQLIKKGVRECETALYDAEYLTTMLRALDGKAGGINLHAPWKQLLLNQFHDIIWGTTSFDAYHESLVRFDLIRSSIAGATQASLREFSRRINTAGKGLPIIVFNSLPWRRTAPVEIKLPGNRPFGGPEQAWVAVDPKGGKHALQRIGKRGGLFIAADMPAGGYRVYWLTKGKLPAAELKVQVGETTLLENKHLRLKIDQTGGTSSLVLKAEGKEFVPAGKPANVPLAFRDTGSAWSSRLTQRLWTEAPQAKIEIAASGPVRAAVRITLDWPGETQTVHTLRIYPDLPIVECLIEGVWNEEKAQLAVDFPIDLQGAAFTEIPFAHLDWSEHQAAAAKSSAIKRARLKYDSPLAAGSAAPQGRWAAIDGGEWTLALLNDAKPAVRIRGGGLQLPILRTPLFVARGKDVMNPTPREGEPGFGAPTHNDLGKFSARYALVAGKGSWRRLGLPRRGAGFAQPLIGVVAPARPGKLPAESELLKVHPANIMVSSLKMAEGDSGEVILRLYETHGQAAEGAVTLPRPAEAVWETDMLENKPDQPAGKGNELSLKFRPHEIKTLRIRFQP